MRASRAYIAGFGTTSVLVASALLLLAVVSALVGFKGWPGAAVNAATGNVVVNDSRRLAADGPVEVALNAGPAVAAVAPSPTFGTAAAVATGLTTTGVAEISRAPAPQLRPAVSVGGTRLPDVEGPSLRPGSPLNPSAGDDPDADLLPGTLTSRPPDNRLGKVLGDTTQGLTDGLGGTVGRLSPQLGGTVTDTGQLLSNLLRGLAPSRPY